METSFLPPYLDAIGAELIYDINAPSLYAVWLDDDCIGSGDTAHDAIEAAETAAEVWTFSSWAEMVEAACWEQLA